MYLRAYSERNRMTYGDMYLSSRDDISLDSSMSSVSSTNSRRHALITSSDESLPDMPHASHMTFDNVDELCEDLKVIVSMADMCDIMFLVGENEIPVYAVKAILATRSRVFYNKFLAEDPKRKNRRATKRRGFLSRFFPLKSCTGGQTVADQGSDKITIAIPDADHDHFRSLIQYLHTGCVKVDMRNLPGLLHLSQIYQVADISHACIDFAYRCMKSTDNLLPLLDSLEPYKHSEYVSRLFHRVLSLIDHEAESLLKSVQLLDLDRDTAFSILLRPELNATEETKLAAILNWSRKFYNMNNYDDFRHTVNILLTNVDLSKIAPFILRRDIAPLRVVPEDILKSCIVQQATDGAVPKSTSKKNNHFSNDRERSPSVARRSQKISNVHSSSQDSAINMSCNGYYF